MPTTRARRRRSPARPDRVALLEERGTPSWMSSVENASVRLWCRNSSASANAMSCWRNIASLPRRINTGDLAASLAAHSATAASKASAATTRLTIPIRSASSASIRSPSSSSSLVFLRPTLR